MGVIITHSALNSKSHRKIKAQLLKKKTVQHTLPAGQGTGVDRAVARGRVPGSTNPWVPESGLWYVELCLLVGKESELMCEVGRYGLNIIRLTST